MLLHFLNGAECHPNHAFDTRDMTFSRWVLGPFLSHMRERNMLSMTSFGRGHILNAVGDATFMFLVQLYENDISEACRAHCS